MVDTLCHPGDDKTCFRCCPPIRVPDYDHLDHRSFISRELRENTQEFHLKGPRFKPIRGFTCWALGYLDPKRRKIGCLLHPFLNGGEDLRHLIDYGEKCRIATCREAKVFVQLSPEHRTFYYSLCRGMDSFQYSSPKANPLFTLLQWGSPLLGEIADLEGHASQAHAVLHRYPFLRISGPTGRRYLAERRAADSGAAALRGEDFSRRLEAFTAWAAARISFPSEVSSEASHTHRLGIDRAFADFLRLECGLKRLDLDTAVELKDRVDEQIDFFFSRNGRGAGESDS